MKQYNYKVVGVTFPARDGSERQDNLKELFNEELETESFLRNHDIKLEGYEFNGEDALAVFVDNKEIGNIPANKVQEVAEIAQRATSCKITLAVNGHDLEDYEYIVDQYKNKKDWKETDPYFDAEEATEKYNELMSELKENTIYSAVLHFIIKEEEDNAEKKVDIPKVKKESPAWLNYVNVILGVVLILMSVLLTLVYPIVGILGIVLGVVIIVYSRKKVKENKNKKE